ncbi:MAG: Uncharacterized protein CEN92_242 [Candidatus Berkelbacteria bacterium Licking1014_96]|uniref:Prepilin-type N-terminal cleavage/methylation domain-containing protein n=1 Tax=Candidatus Berkelbacteria bacterium Licking1014_96 TaxID=2017149 RepID=A0A554LF77_9BACT|nr:MAG: Uncharacterized protein CEN92_242 [Candidatus Berkelbacteria bacterium Licking1014_96]
MRNKGFTLLELVTVIAIISILVATGVPAFANYQRHNSIRIAAQDIKSFLIEARTLSLNPRPEDKGSKYYFAEIGSSTISLGVGDGSGDLAIKEIKFGNDVKVDQGQDTYSYNIPSGEGTFGEGKIVLNLRDPRGGEDIYWQTIAIDGIGGDVKVTEGVTNEE